MNVLLVTGGHDFEREPFINMVSSLKDITFEEVQYPEAEAYYRADKAAHYDAFCFFDFDRTLSDAGKVNLLERLREGKGCLFLHHSIYNHKDWPEYIKILGGFWDFKPFKVEGQTYGPSTYKYEQHLPVHVVDSTHPVTQGMADFELIDEAYGNFYVAPGVTPLLTTHHPDSGSVIAWTKPYERSCIVYLQPGDAPLVYDHPHYRQLIQQALQWVGQSSGQGL